MENVAKAVLRYLFQEYKKAPAVLYSINAVTAFYKADPVAVSEHLLEKKWIREPWVHQNGVVTCRISLEGIKEIDPAFLRAKLKRLIGDLAAQRGKSSLMEIFQNRIAEYAIALDLIYHLEKLGLISILHQSGNVQIELTEPGRKSAENTDNYLLLSFA